MAVKITIIKALEERARNGEDITKAVLLLVDRERERLADKAKPGMAYKDICAAFRGALGNDFVVPPNPSVGWIVRQCARAKDIGLTPEYVVAIAAGARRAYPRGPYQLEFLLRKAPEFGRENQEAEGRVRDAAVLRTGRDDD